ncbi:hypothetical protein E4T39_06299 [Aureobasidium subglaciale]|nr:hypothetical protein E4T39_06299 [Aureobasidium subglaciale]
MRSRRTANITIPRTDCESTSPAPRLAPGANNSFSLNHLSRVYAQPILFVSSSICCTRRNYC